jgi:sarcosine oxidase subunit gamma
MIRRTNVCADNSALKQRGPLAGIAVAGRFGNPDVAIAGVHLDCPDNIDVVRVSPFAGQRRQTSTALRKECGAALPAVGKVASGKGYVVAWAALEAYLVIGEGEGACALYRALAKALGKSAAVVDQSHAYAAVSVSGIKARDLLAKECSVDLHPDAFEAGACAAVQMAHVSVHLRHRGDGEFALLVPVAFAGSFWDWLSESALEFGYEVAADAQ